MNINDISQKGAAGSILSDSSRRDEVKRLAQSVAAEHFGGQQSLQLRQAQNGNSSQVDTARISDEAISEISKAGKPEEMQRTDQLVAALRGAYETKTEKEAASASPERDSGGGAPPKKYEKKKTAHWEPVAQAGQIHAEGREVVGRVTVKEEVRELEGAGAGPKASGGASQGEPPSSSSPNTGNASVDSTEGSKSSNGGSAQPISVSASGNRQQSKVEDGKNDKENAAMAQNMKSMGVQAPGLDNDKGNDNIQVGTTSKDFDVRSSAQGASQTLEMRSAGELGKGEQHLGSFKKLDDKPALKYVSLHSRGQSLERTAEEYAQEAAKSGERPDEIKKDVEQLKKSTPDQ